MRPAKQHQNIIISGASSGLGRALAEVYAQPDVRLFLTGRSTTRLEETADICRAKGAGAEVYPADITDLAAVQSWVDGIAARCKIDLVIANAGTTESNEADGTVETPETTQHVITTNLGGAVNLASSCAKHMQKQRSGSIALVSSIAGIQPIADGIGYGASKAGIIAYGQALGDHLKASDVHVTVFCPGYIHTPMADRFKSWRPLQLSAETAAQKMKRSIEKQRSFHAFPALLYWSARIGSLLPAPLRRVFANGFRYDRDS